MTRLQYLIDCRDRYRKWLAMTPAQLSKVGAGGLTPEKVAPLLDSVEDELIDYIHTSDGRQVFYAEPQESRG